MKKKPKEAVRGPSLQCVGCPVNPPADQNPEVDSFSEGNDKRAGIQENHGDMVDRCGRGDASKGDASRMEESGWMFRHPSGRIPNAANPMIGCGVQQTRETRDGGNRQGGGKPRRRNETRPLAKASQCREDQAKSWPTMREWTSRAQSDGGAIFGNPMRGAWCKTQARTTGKRLHTRVPRRRRRLGGRQESRSFFPSRKKPGKDDEEATPSYPVFRDKA